MDIKEKLDGKKFRKDNSDIIYHFIKGTDTLDITEAGQLNSSTYSIFRSEDDSMVYLQFDIFGDELIHFVYTSLSPLEITLTGRDSRKKLGTLKIIEE